VTVTGKLRTMSLADIMQWLAMSHKSGTLIIEGPRYTRRVLFRHGIVLGVASDNPRELLGYFLVGWRYCTEEQLSEIIEIQRQRGIALGELAFELGYLNAEELGQILEARVRESLMNLVVLEDGDFRFIDGDPGEHKAMEVHLKVEAFLLEAFRRQDELKRMRKLIPDTRAIPVLIAPPDGLSAGQIAIALEMDGRRSIETLALEHRMAPFEVLKLVAYCLEQGLMQLIGPEEDETIPGHSENPLLQSEEEICDRINRGRSLEALRMISETRDRHPDRRAALVWADRMTRKLEAYLDKNSAQPSDILEPALMLDDLINLECAPEEGFVLSRITGFYSSEQILKQLPGSELSNRAIIHNLFRRGLVKIRKATSVRRFHRPES